ncbi:MAG: ATP-binding protein [Saprospiraceae bacterium]|nr:ATP-binding protein [Saprospiraceae bacterium]
MLDKNKIIQDISLLYELSLAVGGSIDLRENCRQFLNTLAARKGLSFASIWLRAKYFPGTAQGELGLLYGTPSSRIKDEYMPEDHPILRKLGEKEAIAIHHDDSDFCTYVQEKNVEKGSYGILRLGNLGILKLYKGAQQERFTDFEFAQIRSVIQKFVISIEGCIAYEKQKIETQERKKVEQELRNTNDRYFDLFENMYDALLIVDKDGAIDQTNRAARQLLELEDEGDEKIFIKEIVFPEDAEKSESFFKKLLKEGFYSDYEGRIVTRSGKVKYIQVNSTAIFKDGEFAGSRDMVRDITKRKEAERALIKAKKEAESARLAEQQFLANMSHEIRTPMNAVVGMTHLLNETKLSDIQQEYLQSLQFSANHLMELINNILDLSKIEAGELVFDNRAFRLDHLLDMIKQTFQLKVKKEPIEVKIEMDEQIRKPFMGDPLRLNQILTNLLGNALKFTHEGEIGIEASLEKQEGETYWILLTIFDTGIGIPVDKLDLIFENFKQADLQVTRKYGGTGLGLSIVKQLVGMLGGNIVVESEVGEGTRFMVLLPFEESEMPSKQLPLIPDPNQSSDLPEGLEVLVVEDNEMNQRLITRVLDRWKSQYEIANDGIEAVIQSRQKKFDVILMDIHMPEMDGVEASRIIRQENENPNAATPIIALTAAALNEEKKRVFDAGMNDFMLKPFVPKALKKLVKKWIKNEPIVVPETVNKDESRASATGVNLDYLYEISGNDKFFVIEMLDTFLAEIPTGIKELQGQLDKEDFARLAKTAHRLKPNLMMVGLPNGEKMAKDLELYAKSEQADPEQIKQMTHQLLAAIDQIIPILKEELVVLKNNS